jgi:hypothetical protein
MKNQIKFLAVIISAITLFACKDKGTYSKMNSSVTTSIKNDTHKIVVEELKDAGTYAYIYVNEAGKNYWMAIPNVKVNIGETYYYNGGMVMKDFESKQLNKTFDEIIFVEGIRTTEEIVETVQKDPHNHTASETPVVEAVKIEKAENGVSLEELFTNKKDLSGKEIIVRGKVVKVNNGIMSKNWVHIVDGTQLENKRDLTITTTEVVKVGDVVTFKGFLVLDKDFGQGYVYDILLEQGVIIK